jgi:hypothetical protein
MPENVWAMLGTMPGGDDEISPPACMERALTYLCVQDQHKFRKEFENRAGDEGQVQHMFRELLAGAFMARQGFTPRYAPDIGGQTPDWHFKREGVGEFIAEFRNFQSPEKIRVAQERALDGGAHIWSGRLPDNTMRLWHSMQEKAGKYKNLATETDLPYVVIVHGLFLSALTQEEVEACILPADGLFADYPDMSGVYNMYERARIDSKSLPIDELIKLYPPNPGDPAEIHQIMRSLSAQILSDPTVGYRFDFYPNPNAKRPTPWLTNGVLPYRFPARQDDAVVSPPSEETKES